jgi:hypothetical protein
VKSLKKCEVSALDSIEGDVLFEMSACSDNNSSNDEWIVVTEILGDSVTSRNVILQCHFVE